MARFSSAGTACSGDVIAFRSADSSWEVGRVYFFAALYWAEDVDEHIDISVVETYRLVNRSVHASVYTPEGRGDAIDLADILAVLLWRSEDDMLTVLHPWELQS